MAAARAVWMGARITWSKSGKRICAISATGLSRRQLKMSVRGLRSPPSSAAQSGAQRPGAGGIMRHVQNPLHAVSLRCAPAGPASASAGFPSAMAAGVMGKP